MEFWSLCAPATCPPTLLPCVEACCGREVGCNSNRLVTLRVMVGTSSSVSPPTTLPTEASRVCNSAPGVELTSSTCCDVPTSSRRLTVYDLPTSITTCDTRNSLNPEWVALNEYVPGGTAGNEYWPELLVSTMRDWFVAASCKTIRAPGTTAPLGSVAVPIRVPVLNDCAERYAAIPASRT